MNSEWKDMLQAIIERLDVQTGLIRGLDQKVNGLEQRMDSLEQRMDSLEQRMNRLDQRVDGLELCMNNRFDSVERQLRLLDADFDLLLKKTNENEREINRIKQSL